MAKLDHGPRGDAPVAWRAFELVLGSTHQRHKRKSSRATTTMTATLSLLIERQPPSFLLFEPELASAGRAISPARRSTKELVQEGKGQIVEGDAPDKNGVDAVAFGFASRDTATLGGGGKLEERRSPGCSATASVVRACVASVRRVRCYAARRAKHVDGARWQQKNSNSSFHASRARGRIADGKSLTELVRCTHAQPQAKQANCLGPKRIQLHSESPPHAPPWRHTPHNAPSPHPCTSNPAHQLHSHSPPPVATAREDHECRDTNGPPSWAKARHLAILLADHHNTTTRVPYFESLSPPLSPSCSCSFIRPVSIRRPCSARRVG